MAVRVLCAKLPEELIDALAPVAEASGVTRNGLVREALEAMIEGRVVPLSEDERLTRDLRRGLRRDLDRMREIATT